MRSESSNNGIGASVRQWVPDSAGDIVVRALSALIIAPLAVYVVYLGSPYMDVVVTLLGAGMAWEWARLCGNGELKLPGYAMISAVGAALAAGAMREYTIAGWIVAVGAMAAVVLAVRDREGTPFWYAVGVLYTAVPCLGIIWLRADPAEGFKVVLWLLCVVWATDTGAYAAGRMIGGPKMAPSISPNKTWAGLAGGMISAGLVGGVTAWIVGTVGIGFLAGVSVVLAVLAQAGDLLESRLKRRFGVKDSSNLIPGHGGLLDRLDGVLAAALTVAVAVRLTGGLF